MATALSACTNRSLWYTCIATEEHSVGGCQYAYVVFYWTAFPGTPPPNHNHHTRSVDCVFSALGKKVLGASHSLSISLQQPRAWSLLSAPVPSALKNKCIFTIKFQPSTHRGSPQVGLAQAGAGQHGIWTTRQLLSGPQSCVSCHLPRSLEGKPPSPWFSPKENPDKLRAGLGYCGFQRFSLARERFCLGFSESSLLGISLPLLLRRPYLLYFQVFPSNILRWDHIVPPVKLPRPPSDPLDFWDSSCTHPVIHRSIGQACYSSLGLSPLTWEGKTTCYLGQSGPERVMTWGNIPSSKRTPNFLSWTF